MASEPKIDPSVDNRVDAVPNTCEPLVKSCGPQLKTQFVTINDERGVDPLTAAD